MILIRITGIALAAVLLFVSCGKSTDPVENSDPVLSAGVVSHFHCVLSWTQLNHQDHEFDSYHLYRSTSPDIAADTSAAECVVTFSEIDQLEYSDSLLSSGAEYYYTLLTRMHESGTDQDSHLWSNEVKVSTDEVINVRIVNTYGRELHVMIHHYGAAEGWLSISGESEKWVNSFDQTSCEASIQPGSQFDFGYPEPDAGADGPRIFFNEHTFDISGTPPNLANYPHIFDKIETNWMGLWNTTCVDFFAIPSQIEYNNHPVGFSDTETRTSIISALLNSNPPYGSLMSQDGNRYYSPQYKRDSSTVSTCLDQAINAGLPRLANTSSTWDYGSGFTYGNITYIAPNKLSATVSGSGISSGCTVTATVTTPGVLGCTIPAEISVTNPSSQESAALAEFPALIGAALNRGVLDNYDNWGARSQPPYYTSSSYNNDEWNYYSMVLHGLSLDNLCYGMPYDDYYQQNTGVTPVPGQGLVTITILPFN